MKGRIFLSENKFSDYDYDVDFDQGYGYCIMINTNLVDSFSDLIANSHELGISIEQELSLIESLDFAKEEVSLLEEVKTNKEKFLLDAEYVEFSFEIDRIISYIKVNPILKTKKILLNESIGLNKEVLDKIMLELEGDVSNLYFKLFDNTKLISFDECVNTFEILDKMVKDVERYDFSPIEKIMYVYDMVRDRVYLDVSQGDDLAIPRDLSSVLLGNNIVCLGYARIFNSVLEKLGIKTREVLLFNRDDCSGHARNEIYVKDDKYDIDGVYYFDPTWDSKKSDNDNSFLLSYKYFAKTKTYMDLIDSGLMIDKKFPYFSSFMESEISDIFNNYGFDKIPKEMLKSINYMSTLINGKYLIDFFRLSSNSPLYGMIDIEQISEDLALLVDYFDRPIHADTLLEVLYNVRKIQYYNEPEKFSFSFDEFYKIIRASNWGFVGDTPYEKMLVGIFNKKLINWELYKKYDDKENLSKNIESVRLVKTLRKIYDNKHNDV